MEGAQGVKRATLLLSSNVKGIYDYADGHKDKDWQAFAAATAASVTKAASGNYTLKTNPAV